MDIESSVDFSPGYNSKKTKIQVVLPGTSTCTVFPFFHRRQPTTRCPCRCRKNRARGHTLNVWARSSVGHEKYKVYIATNHRWQTLSGTTRRTLKTAHSCLLSTFLCWRTERTLENSSWRAHHCVSWKPTASSKISLEYAVTKSLSVCALPGFLRKSSRHPSRCKLQNFHNILTQRLQQRTSHFFTLEYISPSDHEWVPATDIRHCNNRETRL